jgi:hypothetical protein
VGRQSGLYPPSAQPESQYKEKKSNLDTFSEEFWKEMARKVVRGNRNPQV